jgi:O-methyltransferase
MRKARRLLERGLLKCHVFLTLAMRYLDRPLRIDITESPDFVRLSSLELAAQEVYSRGIEGDAAELGVYRGNFARKINEAFPDRKLYLFDTFEGFAQNDLSDERRGEFSSGEQDFSRTSAGLVLRRMPHPARCIVRKGTFPETAAGIDAEFVFVSIDADLFAPTLEGLKFFYPRMAPGGFIFVHDYSNARYRGVGEAVRKFCSEGGVRYFPLCDTCGSVVIAT